LEKVAEACKKLGSPDVKVIQMDVADTKTVTAFFDEKIIEYNVDLFIANAGVATIPGLSVLDQAEQVLQINTMGTIAGMNAAYKAFKKRGRGGQIASVSSVFGFINPPAVLSYGASKAAVMSYTRDLRALGKDDGITINTIAPGFIKTAMTSSFAKKDGFYLTPEYFAEKVKHGLANDVPLISLPLHQFFAFGIISVLPPAAKQCVSDFLHKYVDRYLAKSKKRNAETADSSTKSH
jgi:NAD(P)-dependent dehydrogenase (short-subunit alcohol dehydrogenase family)